MSKLIDYILASVVMLKSGYNHKEKQQLVKASGLWNSQGSILLEKAYKTGSVLKFLQYNNITLLKLLWLCILKHALLRTGLVLHLQEQAKSGEVSTVKSTVISVRDPV